MLRLRILFILFHLFFGWVLQSCQIIVVIWIAISLKSCSCSSNFAFSKDEILLRNRKHCSVRIWNRNLWLRVSMLQWVNWHRCWNLNRCLWVNHGILGFRFSHFWFYNLWWRLLFTLNDWGLFFLPLNWIMLRYFQQWIYQFEQKFLPVVGQFFTFHYCFICPPDVIIIRFDSHRHLITFFHIWFISCLNNSSHLE